MMAENAPCFSENFPLEEAGDGIQDHLMGEVVKDL